MDPSPALSGGKIPAAIREFLVMQAPPAWHERLSTNLMQVRERIAAACRRADRAPEDVRLVAVTKYVTPEVIRALFALGVSDMGESRVQQLVERATAIDSVPEASLDDAARVTGGAAPRWHMVGHLQRNKARLLLPHCRILHSLDSPRLAEELQQRTAPGKTIDVLIEVNVAGEASKNGVPPMEIGALADALSGLDRVRLRGLMTMAPLHPDPEAARPHFARLRGLLEKLRERHGVGPQCRHLSMGMTQDFGVAVEEGATLVRVGSALFAGLPAEQWCGG